MLRQERTARPHRPVAGRSPTGAERCVGVGLGWKDFGRRARTGRTGPSTAPVGR